MSLKAFFVDGLERFAGLNMDRAAFSGNQLTFIRIPKTAGRLSETDIADVKQPELNIEVDYRRLDPSRPKGPLHWNTK